MRKLLLLAFALLPALLFAQGFQVNLLGEKQIGMGHTGTGLVTDGATVVFNPGAVVMLPENYIQAGASPLLFKSDFNPSGTTAQYYTKNEIAYPFNFYGAWGPKGGWWKVGLGVYTPFGGLADWGDNWQGKYVLEKLDLKAIYFQPTLSVKLADYLSVGAGFVYNYGSVDLTQAIPLANEAGQDGQGELKGNGHGFGYNLGIFLKTEIGMTVGITYRSEVKTTINGGNATFVVPPSLTTSFPQPNAFNSTLPLPATTSIGFGFYPSKRWTLALDMNYIQWDVYKTLEFDYAKTTAVLQNYVSPRNYQNAVSLRGGGQYQATDNLFLRFGGGYAATAVQDGYVTPEAPDADRVYVTGGIGYKIAHHVDVDLSFEYEHVMPRTQTNIQSQLSGTFETNVYIPGISLAYHW
jgi:long-chain fatty acid transport protein